MIHVFSLQMKQYLTIMSHSGLTEHNLTGQDCAVKTNALQFFFTAVGFLGLRSFYRVCFLKDFSNRRLI